MKILVVSSQYPPHASPESAHTLLLCEELAARGVEVDLLTSELLPGFPAPKGFGLHPLIKSWGFRHFVKLVLFIRRLRPDGVLLIYIDWIYGWHPMVSLIPAVFRRLRPDMPFVTQFENVSGLTVNQPVYGRKAHLLKSLLGWLVGRRRLDPVYGSLLSDSSRVIALSEHHLETFEKAHPGISQKTEVVPAPPLLRFAADAESARKRGRTLLGLSEEELVLIYFGYVYEMKGMETLLTAFGSLPSNIRLVIAGDGDIDYLRSLHELSRAVGGAERIIWAGHCKPEEETASVYLHAADICVLPFNDGVRLNNSSFAVAASHGLPIVTTRGDSLETPFLDGENVRLCPPKNPAALAAAITELVHSPKTRKRLAAGALELARSHFSWNRAIDATMRAFRMSAEVK